MRRFPSVRHRSPTTPAPARRRWSRCRSRRAPMRRRSRPRACAGSWPIRLLDAAAVAGKVQGRRTTVGPASAAPRRCMPECPPGGVQLATQWVEPAYLEPDASWCEPGGVPASAARQRGRVRGQGRIPPHRRRPVSSPTTSVAPCASPTPARTSSASVRSGRRSRRSRFWSTGSSRSTVWSRAAPRGRRAWPAAAGVEVAGALDGGRRRRTGGELSAACGRSRGTGAARRGRARARHRGRHADRRRCAHAEVTVERGKVDARRRHTRCGRPARRDRAAVLRDRSRAHGAGVGHERGPGRRRADRRDTRPHDPLVRRAARRPRRRPST